MKAKTTESSSISENTGCGQIFGHIEKDFKSIRFNQRDIKKIFLYNKHSGVFKWKKDIGTRIKRNDIVKGSVNKKGYKKIQFNKFMCLSHRLAWLYVYGEHPRGQIDHINHNKLDNRICNLRVVSNQENQKNKSHKTNNISGIIGVYLRSNGKWRAIIGIDGKLKHLGTFVNKRTAILARRIAELNYGFHNNHGKEIV